FSRSQDAVFFEGLRAHNHSQGGARGKHSSLHGDPLFSKQGATLCGSGNLRLTAAGLAKRRKTNWESHSSIILWSDGGAVGGRRTSFVTARSGHLSRSESTDGGDLRAASNALCHAFLF